MAISVKVNVHVDWIHYIHKTVYPYGLNSYPMDYIQKTEYPNGLNSHTMGYINKTE